MSPRVHRIAANLIMLAATPGCTTLGGNVHGSFACSAPAGSCAPTSVIDDRALALISGEAGPPPAPAERPEPGRSARLERAAAPTSARTGERVLRIVLPAYVDEAGRLHETAAVRAVVATGRWRPVEQTVADAERAGGVLAALAQSEDGGTETHSGLDPEAPDPVAVGAARARLDPLGAIRADVDARLAKARDAKPAAPDAQLRPAAIPGKTPPALTGTRTPAEPATTLRAPAFPAPASRER